MCNYITCNRHLSIICHSDGNKGAYWKTGYGEGINKKIFYICDKQKYEEYKNNNKKISSF